MPPLPPRPREAPDLGFGVGLRPKHYPEVLARARNGELEVDWFEAISENYLVRGGRPLRVLGDVRAARPLALHGVSMNLGSSDPLDEDYLRELSALATRFQADRDLVVQAGFRALPLDPSLAGARTGAKAGFDLTLPPGEAAGIEAMIPEPPRLEGRRFPSVEAALADGPKTFEALMAALASRDGREVVVALEALRFSGRLAREKDGRYALASHATAK